MRRWSCAGAGAALCALFALAGPTATAEPTDPAEAKGPGTSVAPPEAAAAVEDVEALVRAARFEETLARADALRDSVGPIDSDGGDPELVQLRVRLEIAAGTAQIALGRDGRARECFRRALAAEPALDLDRDATAPKVLRVFHAVRAEPRATR